jgi:hypothetical protein
MYHQLAKNWVQRKMDGKLVTCHQGTIDVLTRDHWLPDLKTADKSKNPGEANTSLQLTFRAGLVTYQTGKWPAKVSLEVLVNSQEPKWQSLPTQRGAADWANLLARIQLTLAQIQEKVCSAMPRVRQTWAAVWPWAKATFASLSFPMIYSGVNRFLLISLPPFDPPL